MKRHDWVQPRGDARPAFLTADPEALAFAHDWIALGRPLVVTRQSPAAGAISLGLALPPAYATRRLACTLSRHAVQGHRGPLSIEEVTPVLCVNDRRALRNLAGELATLGFTVGVYGSSAWQCLSGLAYRHDASDIDVVCDAGSPALTGRELEACLRALDTAAHEARSRLDGEIRFADGRAVAWRELAQARIAPTGVVLAKGERDVALLPWRQLVAAA